MEHFLRDKILPKYLHSLLKVLLFTFAIFPKKYKLLGLSYYGMAITITGGALLGSVITLCVASQSQVKLEIFSTTIPQISDIVIFLYFSHKEKEILNGIQLLTRKSSSNMLQRLDELLKTNFVKYVILHTAWASLFVLSTIFYLLSNRKFSHKYSLMIPFWLSCDVADDIRLCWKIDSRWELLLANIFTTTAVGVDYSIYCAALILYSVFMTNVYIHFETIKAATRELAERMKFQRRVNWLKLGKDSEYDEVIISEFYDNIKHQQMIRKYCNEIIDIMTGYASIFLAEFWGALVFLGFWTIMEVILHTDRLQVKNDRLILMKTLIISVSGAIGFVIHCMYAQVVADSNEMILRELSDIPWYEQSIKFRKIYLMCLTHNQKPIEVTASGMFTFNYGFSMNCLKTMYSFLNMMLLHYKRKGY